MIKQASHSVAIVAAVLCLGGPAAQAQERIEYSAVGPYAAGAFEGAGVAQPDYNLKLGPVLFTMDAGVGVGYNSNVNLAEEGKISDGFVQPNVGISAFWQATELNSLSLNLGLAYTAYFNTPEADTKSILIDPGSDLSWDIYIGDFKVTLFDSFYLPALSVGSSWKVSESQPAWVLRETKLNSLWSERKIV